MDNTCNNIISFLANTAADQNAQLLDTYINNIKNDTCLTYEQQKTLLADASKLSLTNHNAHKEILDILDRLDFDILKNIIKKYEQ